MSKRWEMKKIIPFLFGLFCLAAPIPALAQTGCSAIVAGAVLTAGQWQNCFQSKLDYLGFTPLNPSSLVGATPVSVSTGAGITTISLAACGGNGQVLFWASSSWACSAQPSLGAVGNAGTIIFNGGTSGTITLQSSAVAGNWSLTFPTGAGSSGQILSTNGSGVTSWINTGSGTVTSVTCGSGLTGGTITTTGTCAADTGTSGAKIPLLNGANTWSAKQSLTSTDSLAMANGTTGQRPGSPAAGDTRYNSTLNGLEFYNGTTWIVIGQQPTVQRFTSGTAQTYTATTGVTRQRVRMVGGGGGGGAVITNSGTSGTSSSFQVNGSGTAWTAVFGSSGVVGSGSRAGGAGGTGGVDGSTGTLTVRIKGSNGGDGSSNLPAWGAPGGHSYFVGAGAMSTGSAGGNAAQANSGSGGGGPSSSASSNGGGGGGAEYAEFWVTGMTTATYTVGLGGAGGAAGTIAGGNGAAGIILIEEFYNKFLRSVCDSPVNDNYRFEECKAA